LKKQSDGDRSLILPRQDQQVALKKKPKLSKKSGNFGIPLQPSLQFEKACPPLRGLRQHPQDASPVPDFEEKFVVESRQFTYPRILLRR
jgi:hypothetical protein